MYTSLAHERKVRGLKSQKYQLQKWLQWLHKERTVFSLNYSSAGKGPFMDGKAKNIYFFKRGGEGGQWSEGRGPALTGKFFIPIF